MPTDKPRFLVLRGGAIGDLIVTLPALQALRGRWPGAYIELVGYPHVANLALAGGLVNAVASLDQAGIARFFALKPMFTPEQVEYVRSFDVVISYLHDPEESVRKNLGLAGAKQVIYGSPIVTASHAIEHLMKPLETLAIYPENPVPTLRFADVPPAEVAGRLAFHPGSGSPKKNWPLENFVALARRFPGRVLFLAGEADDAIAVDLRIKAPDVPLVTGKTLLEVGRLLSACAGYVGNDSGITHLAAAVGIPVVALFGPTSALQWGPRGPNVKVISAPRGDLCLISPEDVLKAMNGF